MTWLALGSLNGCTYVHSLGWKLNRVCLVCHLVHDSCYFAWLLSQEDLSQQVKSINEALQAFVDPFDLDVFMPYLLSNLENQLSRLPVNILQCMYS